MKTYIFEIRFRSFAKHVSRTIEMREDQTLIDLNDAFQNEIGWDNDHLYSFFFVPSKEYLNKMRKELEREHARRQFKPGCEEKARKYIERELKRARIEYALPYELDEEQKSADVKLSQLNLEPGIKFDYLFDWGDSNKFEIAVTGEGKTEDGAEYPRVIARKGNPPAQYPDW